MTNPLPGLTNIVHWIDNDGTPTIIRHGRPFAELLGIDRSREVQVLRQIRHLGIGPELLSIDLQTDQTIFRAIPGVSLENVGASPVVLAQSLTVLGRLHKQPAIGTPFSASRSIRHYLAMDPLPRVLHDFCEHQAAICAELERPAEFTLCHNDCVAKNWILKPDGGLSLIDYEFAAPNDPVFDLATWCLTFNIEPEDPLLNAYGCWEQRLPSRIRAFMPVVDALWTLYCRSLSLRVAGNAHTAALHQMNSRILRMTGGGWTGDTGLAV